METFLEKFFVFSLEERQQHEVFVLEVFKARLEGPWAAWYSIKCGG